MSDKPVMRALTLGPGPEFKPQIDWGPMPDLCPYIKMDTDTVLGFMKSTSDFADPRQSFTVSGEAAICAAMRLPDRYVLGVDPARGNDIGMVVLMERVGEHLKMLEQRVLPPTLSIKLINSMARRMVRGMATCAHCERKIRWHRGRPQHRCRTCRRPTELWRWA